MATPPNLSAGWDGGVSEGAVAYNLSVPEGWDETDLGAYTRQRRRDAGFDEAGPTLFTGVALHHARRARLDPVTVYATAGLSNPAALPMEPPAQQDGSRPTDDGQTPGTVNLLVGTTRGLNDGALANLVAVVAEAKAATLLAEAGFPGTTTDAVVVGCDPDGEPAQFSGSATPVGAAARVCVRDAVRASLASRYSEGSVPETVAAAEHGFRPDREATVSRVPGADDGV